MPNTDNSTGVVSPRNLTNACSHHIERSPLLFWPSPAKRVEGVNAEELEPCSSRGLKPLSIVLSSHVSSETKNSRENSSSTILILAEVRQSVSQALEFLRLVFESSCEIGKDPPHFASVLF
jgi:hypothetical protein